MDGRTGLEIAAAVQRCDGFRYTLPVYELPILLPPSLRGAKAEAIDLSFKQRHGSLRFPRNDEVVSSRATKQLDGQITQNLSSSAAKNIPLPSSGKSLV
jgi:hypothetical protein